MSLLYCKIYVVIYFSSVCLGHGDKMSDVFDCALCSPVVILHSVKEFNLKTLKGQINLDMFMSGAVQCPV